MSTKIACKKGRGRYIRTAEIKEKNRKASTGHQAPQSQKYKVSEFMKKWHKDHIHPRQGKKHSAITLAKMSEQRKGSGNGNWKGGVTLSVRTFRKSKQYQQWRKSVFEKDNYICRDCGCKEDLVAHHIYSVKIYPKLRLQIDNGLTLCTQCHKRRHYNVA